MFEAVVANVLNSFLGTYVDNLENKQLTIGIWNGDVALKNLRLKKQALDNLSLPIDVSHGIISELTLKIPWKNLKTKAVQVDIEDLILIAVPRKASPQYNPEEEENRREQEKQEKLKTAEIFSRAKRAGGQISPDLEDKKNSSFTTQLATKILDNLQFRIRNIHIRYEDRISNPNDIFSVGIILQELSAVSTDENWQESFIHNDTDTIHKLCTLKNLSLYWNSKSELHSESAFDKAIARMKIMILESKEGKNDTNFILKPINSTGKIILRKKVKDPLMPKTLLTLICDHFKFSIDNYQYQNIWYILNMIQLYKKQFEYHHIRPAQQITPKDNPRMWWKFAINAVVNDIHEKNKKWTWIYFKSRREVRKKYVGMWTEALLLTFGNTFDDTGKCVIPEDKLQALQSLEKDISYNDIRFYRSIARVDFQKKRKTGSIPLSPIKSPNTPTSKWWGGWWGSTNTEEHIKKEDIEELYDTIDYNENEELEIDMPQDWTLLAVQFNLALGSFSLLQRSMNKAIPLFTVVFNSLSMKMIKKFGESFGIDLSLGSLRVCDGTVSNTLYPLIIRNRKEGDLDKFKINNEQFQLLEDILQADDANPFFTFSFEHAPIMCDADNRLAITCRPLEIIYNPLIYKTLSNFLKPMAASNEPFAALKAVAESTLSNISLASKASLMNYALETHKTLDLKIDIAAPIFIFPEDCTSKLSNVVVLDAGRFQVDSDLVDKAKKLDLQNKERTGMGEKDILELQKLMYDRFNVSFSNMQLLVGNSIEECITLAKTNTKSTKQHFVDKVDISFIVEMLIFPRFLNMTKLKVSGGIPVLKLNISDLKYNSMMKILDIVLDSISDSNSTSQIQFDPNQTVSRKTVEDFVVDVEQSYDSGLASPLQRSSSNILRQLQDKLFELDFEIASVSAILECNQQGGGNEMVSEANFRSFKITTLKRPFDLTVNAVIQGFFIRHSPGEEFSNFTAKSIFSTDKDQMCLLNIAYRDIDSLSEEFQTLYKSIHRWVDIKFYGFDLLVNPEPILALNNFIFDTFMIPNNAKKKEEQQQLEKTNSTSESQKLYHITAQAQHLHVYLIKNGTSLSRLKFNEGSITILSRPDGSSRTTGILSHIEMYDDGTRTNLDTSKTNAREILTIQGDTLAEFVWETFSRTSSTYPGFDTLFDLKADSIKLRVSEEFFVDLITFLKEFQQLKGRGFSQKSSIETLSNSTRSTLIHYNVTIKTPILLFPKNLLLDDTIIANLGQISLTNTFEEYKLQNESAALSIPFLKEKMQIDITSIKLTSILFENGKKQTLRILDDVNVTTFVDILAQHKYDKDPRMKITFDVSDVTMNMTEIQYVFLYSILGYVSRIWTTYSNNSPDVLGMTTSSIDSSPGIRTVLSQKSTNLDIQMVVNFPTIKLNTYSGGGFYCTSLLEVALSEFSLNKLAINYCTYEDQSKQIQFVLESFLVKDKRPGKSLYQQVFLPPVSSDKPLLLCTYKSDINGRDIKDYFMKPFSSPVLLEKCDELVMSDLSNSTTETMTKANVGSTFWYQFRLVEADITLLEDPQSSTSEAILLNIKDFCIKYEDVFRFDLAKVATYMHRMDDKKETTVRIIQDFDLTLTMDLNRETGGQIISTVVMDVQPLVLRVSYHDMIVMLKIFNRASELSDQSTTTTLPEETKSKIKQMASQKLYDNTVDSIRKESMQIKFHGLRLILIDDLNDLHIPMFDCSIKNFLLYITDWSTVLKLESKLQSHFDFFNVRNSHWEPIMEPWELSINYARDINEATLLSVTSKKWLDLNVSSAFIETAINSWHMWQKVQSRIHRRKVHAPYVFRNRTGYTLMVWSNQSTSDDIKLVELRDGQDIEWRYEDWKQMREETKVSENKISIQLMDEPYQAIKGIITDKEGTFTYFLQPKATEVFYRLICHVKLEMNVKVVTFRSPFYFQNCCDLPIDIGAVSTDVSKLRAPKIITVLQPGEFWYVPIPIAYKEKLKIRPQETFGYFWCHENIAWEKSPGSFILNCKGNDRSLPSMFFMATVVVQDRQHSKMFPDVLIKVCPPLQLENLLPYEINFRIINNDASGTIQRVATGTAMKGCLSFIYIIDVSQMVSLTIDIPDTVFGRSDSAVILNSNIEYVDDKIAMRDSSGSKLWLKLMHNEPNEEIGSQKVTIYSPYIMMNKTGLNISVKAHSLISSSKVAAGEGMCGQYSKKPFLFSYSESSIRSRASVKVDDTDWSRPLSFEAIGSSYEISVPSYSGENLYLGASVAEGYGKLSVTKFISFTPRFILVNKTLEDFQCRAYGSKKTLVVKSQQRIPLFYFRDDAEKLISLRLAKSYGEWCSSISVRDVGKIHAKLSSVTNETEFLISIEVILQNSVLFVLIRKEEGKWPYRIENATNFAISINQKDAKRKYNLAPKEKIPFALDHPNAREKLLVINIFDCLRTISLNELGSLPPMNFKKGEEGGMIDIQVFLEGPVEVVRLSQYDPKRSIYKIKNKASFSETKFEVIDSAAKLESQFQFQLEGVGISFINQSVQEISYISFKGFDFAYITTNKTETINLKLRWLQIDNQQDSALDPIVLYPTVVSAANVADSPPAFHLTLVKSKDTSYGVEYYNYFTILLQEMSIELEETFLFSIVEFAKLDIDEWKKSEKIYEFDQTDIPEPQLEDLETQMYFEIIHLQPVKINLSFVKSEGIKYQTGMDRYNPVHFAVNVMTTAFGNVHNAKLTLNALFIEHPIVSFPRLMYLITQHYTQDVLNQWHKLIGSADVLGNPVGFFDNVSSGIVDMFYEPYQGFVSERPQDIGAGLAKGTKSFIQKTTFGFSDTISKFTSSVGKGLAVITMDEDFQKQRRMIKSRNRPRHAAQGVSSGATSFARSFASGIKGVVQQPLEGAEKHGVGGFIKGIGKGLIGVVTKPVIGAFDLANEVSEGIKSAATDSEGLIDRARHPRHTGKDGVLQPYSALKAKGQYWLKSVQSGNYRNSVYIAHLETAKHGYAAILTTDFILACDTVNLKKIWKVNFEDLQTCYVEPGKGIVLMTRNRYQDIKPFGIPVTDNKEAEWFTKLISEYSSLYYAAQECTTPPMMQGDALTEFEDGDSPIGSMNWF